jgi:hypothetical protein
MPRDNSHGDIVYYLQDVDLPYQYAFTIVILLLSKTNYEKTFQAFLEILFNPKILLNQLPVGCWEKALIAPAICHNKPNTLLGWSTVLQ